VKLIIAILSRNISKGRREEIVSRRRLRAITDRVKMSSGRGSWLRRNLGSARAHKGLHKAES
jgi:hypothetical protein